MDNMKISVIVPIYNFTIELYELTKAALKTLKADEHILIDNNSTVGEINEIKDWTDIYVRNKINLGYPAAVNQGIKLASGELIAISNNDVRVEKNWLTIAKEIFNEDEKVGSVHFRMTDYDIPMELGEKTWITGKERWCSSSFFVIRKETIPEGGYDLSYTTGGFDDWDFWTRVRQQGWKTAYTTKSCYQHKHSSTLLALDRRDGDRAERDIKNREYFKAKFGDYPEDLFAKTYPEQMKINYYNFLNEL